MAQDERLSTNRNKIVQLILASFRDDELTGVVSAATNIDASSEGWAAAPLCERNNYYLVFKQANYSGSTQDCFAVSHVNSTLTNNAKQVWKDAFAQIARLGRNSAKTHVRLYMRAADNKNFLDVFYYFNPEFAGVSPPNILDWPNNDWHYTQVKQHPDKEQFYQKVVAWGHRMRPHVMRGLKGQKTLQSPFDLEGVKQTSERGGGTSEASSSDLEERLKQLRRLHEQGLVSGEEYEAKRRELLKGL
ncbi:MAG: SHOCT domain-containing protein [Acetobacterales bacterium]